MENLWNIEADRRQFRRQSHVTPTLLRMAKLIQVNTSVDKIDA